MLVVCLYFYQQFINPAPTESNKPTITPKPTPRPTESTSPTISPKPTPGPTTKPPTVSPTVSRKSFLTYSFKQCMEK